MLLCKETSAVLCTCERKSLVKLWSQFYLQVMSENTFTNVFSSLNYNVKPKVTRTNVNNAAKTQSLVQTFLFSLFVCSHPAALTHLSPLLGTGRRAAGAARCGSQQPPASQQAQPGTRQTPGGHLELAKAPPDRHAAPNTASGGERVGLTKTAAADKKGRWRLITVIVQGFEPTIRSHAHGNDRGTIY